jgi:hypothetical protein
MDFQATLPPCSCGPCIPLDTGCIGLGYGRVRDALAGLGLGLGVMALAPLQHLYLHPVGCKVPGTGPPPVPLLDHDTRCSHRSPFSPVHHWASGSSRPASCGPPAQSCCRPCRLRSARGAAGGRLLVAWVGTPGPRCTPAQRALRPMLSTPRASAAQASSQRTAGPNNFDSGHMARPHLLGPAAVRPLAWDPTGAGGA